MDGAYGCGFCELENDLVQWCTSKKSEFEAYHLSLAAESKPLLERPYGLNRLDHIVLCSSVRPSVPALVEDI